MFYFSYPTCWPRSSKTFFIWLLWHCRRSHVNHVFVLLMLALQCAVKLCCCSENSKIIPLIHSMLLEKLSFNLISQLMRFNVHEENSYCKCIKRNMLRAKQLTSRRTTWIKFHQSRFPYREGVPEGELPHKQCWSVWLVSSTSCVGVCDPSLYKCGPVNLAPYTSCVHSTETHYSPQKEIWVLFCQWVFTCNLVWQRCSVRFCVCVCVRTLHWK